MKLELRGSNGDWWIADRIRRNGASGFFWYLRKDGTIHTLLRGTKDHFKTKGEVQYFLSNWLPISLPLTKDFVKWKASLGDKEALDCSIEHWKQIVLLGLEAKEISDIGIGDEYCALCQRYREFSGCGKCPLSCFNPKSVYYKVSVAWFRFNCDSQKFETASINMLNELIRIRNEKYKEKEMVEMTVKEVAERLGIDEVKIVKEKSVEWKFGDTAHCRKSHGTYERILLFNDKGKLNWHNAKGNSMSISSAIDEFALNNNFKKTGSIFD